MFKKNRGENTRFCGKNPRGTAKEEWQDRKRGRKKRSPLLGKGSNKGNISNVKKPTGKDKEEKKKGKQRIRQQVKSGKVQTLTQELSF